MTETDGIHIDDLIAEAVKDRHHATQQIAQHFRCRHLPDHLARTSAYCGHLVLQMLHCLPDGPELTTGLRKLLEAKDCFVRAAVQ